MYNASTRPLDAWDEANLLALQVKQQEEKIQDKQLEENHDKPMRSVNGESEQAGIGVDQVEREGALA